MRVLLAVDILYHRGASAPVFQREVELAPDFSDRHGYEMEAPFFSVLERLFDGRELVQIVLEPYGDVESRLGSI